MTSFMKRIESSYPQLLLASICGKVQRCNGRLQMNRNIPVACLHGTGIAGKVATFPAGEGSDRLLTMDKDPSGSLVAPPHHVPVVLNRCGGARPE